MLEATTQYVTVERNDWPLINRSEAVVQANQNLKTESDSAPPRKIPRMGSITKRSIVLAQIFSPSGRIHLHHGTFYRYVTCFPQSVCWRFPNKGE